MWKRWLLVFTGVTHATILHTGQHESPSSSRTVPQEHEISYYTQPNRWHTQLLHRGEKYMWVCVSCKGRQYYNDKRNKIRILPACLFPSVMSACVLWLQKKVFSSLYHFQDLKRYGATTVVRVCDVTYDKTRLEKDGITVVVSSETHTFNMNIYSFYDQIQYTRQHLFGLSFRTGHLMMEPRHPVSWSMIGWIC